MIPSMRVSFIRVRLTQALCRPGTRFPLPRFDSKISEVSSYKRQESTSSHAASSVSWTSHPLKPLASSELSSTPLTPKEDPKKKSTAYIALGSNLGDRISWIEKACNLMPKHGITVKRTSSLWETEPMYVVDQDSFINGACEVETELEPIALLDALQSIENELGRKKVIDKGPRNIDLDILLYDDQAVSHDRLTVPHPGMSEREFVLRPLAELIPGRALDSASPWKVTMDYLNALPPTSTPLSTITPLSSSAAPIRALQSNRPTQVMAIMNMTPDSFSDGGSHYKAVQDRRSDRSHRATRSSSGPEFALANKIAEHVAAGATIIDIGGQSTAPGAKEVTVAEELSRVVPTVQLIKTVFKGEECPLISVDTYRAKVAEAALEAGADIINDVSAGVMGPDMLPTIARLGKTICLMHMRGTPATMNDFTDYSPDGLIPTMAKELLERVAAAEDAGIRRWRIILDPGIGFAKTLDQNVEILRRFDELRDWPGLKGLPWLVGSSRKRFIGHITGVKKAEKRDWGTAATVAAAVHGGADIVRVHDVVGMSSVVKMSDAIWRA